MRRSVVMTSTWEPASGVEVVLAWYAEAQRPLPWRAPGTSPWGVLVSEFMCQQTQVDRVAPRWRAWLERWPTPSALADAPVAEAIRMWDRLGYPRRARWLHQAASTIASEFDDEVPSERTALTALPGVGDYTAAAVRAFAFGLPDVVLDTNVRRVIGRVIHGTALPKPAIAKAERATAQQLVDAAPARAQATWSQAVMELGALVCTARTPNCAACPLQDHCRWRALGFPASAVQPRRQKAFAGSDRQARGAVLAALRSADLVSTADLALAWADDDQRERAVSSLLADGLIEQAGSGWRLPTTH